jgi:hypothetical protein
MGLSMVRSHVWCPYIMCVTNRLMSFLPNPVVPAVKARNVVSYRPTGEEGKMFLLSTTYVEVEALVPRGNVIPRAVLSRGGSLVIQGVLNVMVPRFVKVREERSSECDRETRLSDKGPACMRQSGRCWAKTTSDGHVAMTRAPRSWTSRRGFDRSRRSCELTAAMSRFP